MHSPARPLEIALVAARPETVGLVGALLAQYRRTSFNLESVDLAAAPGRMAAGAHDAYLLDEPDLPGGGVFAQAVATGRAVVVLVGDEDVDRDEALVAEGAWDCLAKRSVTPASLGRTLRRAVQASHERAVQEQREHARTMDALARFAGRAAHDFNNLLTAMLGYAELLRSSLDASDARRDDVREIQLAGERATSLTRQLLAFGRPQSQRPRLVDLGALVRAIVPSLAPLLGGGGVGLSVETEPDLPPILADTAQIEQVISILAVNARDAMPSGGRVTIEASAVDLGPAWAATHLDAEAGRHVMLAIGDTGCGMTADVRAHLFEPFFSTKPKGKGIGLGLAMVDGMVRQARGHIAVVSEPGRGTTVRIYFPVAREASAARS